MGPQPTSTRTWPRRIVLTACAALAVLVVAAGLLVVLEGTVVSPHRQDGPQAGPAAQAAPRGASATTTTASSSSPTTSSVPLPQPAGPGFVPGKVTAVGDSVMIDYQDPLRFVIPGISVDAAVSRQWSDGETILQGMKSAGELGADVIVGLGTNGPITDTSFDSMMAILGGASRVVFVNLHVDQPWQDPNNAVLARGAARYHNVVVANWYTLATHNPQWFGSDSTHLAIDGPGADAVALLVATTLANG
jgi:hypothetical protein